MLNKQEIINFYYLLLFFKMQGTYTKEESELNLFLLCLRLNQLEKRINILKYQASQKLAIC